MHGFLTVLKQPGAASRAITTHLDYAFHRKLRIGHIGTLDPFAGGVLTVSIGEANSLSPLLPERKAYRGTIKLGLSTTSDDCTGELLREQQLEGLCSSSHTVKLIEEQLQSFVGHVPQRPPNISAISVDGHRAYKLFRQARAREAAPGSDSPAGVTSSAELGRKKGQLHVHVWKCEDSHSSLSSASALQKDLQEDLQRSGLPQLKERLVRIDRIQATGWCFHAGAAACATVAEGQRAACAEDVSTSSAAAAAGLPFPLCHAPELSFELQCGPGVYVRSIARDLGEKMSAVLGRECEDGRKGSKSSCGNALLPSAGLPSMLSCLYRTESSGFTDKDPSSVSFQDIQSSSGSIWANILPSDEAFLHLPAVLLVPPLPRGESGQAEGKQQESEAAAVLQGRAQTALQSPEQPQQQQQQLSKQASAQAAVLHSQGQARYLKLPSSKAPMLLSQGLPVDAADPSSPVNGRHALLTIPAHASVVAAWKTQLEAEQQREQKAITEASKDSHRSSSSSSSSSSSNSRDGPSQKHSWHALSPGPFSKLLYSWKACSQATLSAIPLSMEPSSEEAVAAWREAAAAERRRRAGAGREHLRGGTGGTDAGGGGGADADAAGERPSPGMMQLHSATAATAPTINHPMRSFPSLVQATPPWKAGLQQLYADKDKLLQQRTLVRVYSHCNREALQELAESSLPGLPRAAREHFRQRFLGSHSSGSGSGSGSDSELVFLGLAAVVPPHLLQDPAMVNVLVTTKSLLRKQQEKMREDERLKAAAASTLQDLPGPDSQAASQAAGATSAGCSAGGHPPPEAPSPPVADASLPRLVIVRRVDVSPLLESCTPSASK